MARQAAARRHGTAGGRRARPEVVALDGEACNSTFAAFLSRGYDFLRMAGISASRIAAAARDLMKD